MQEEFKFTAKPITTKAAGELDKLLAFLRCQKDWLKSKEIEAATGFSSRKIRSLVTMSKGAVISGPGSRGYMHILNANPDQIRETKSRLRHMAKGLLDRVADIDKRFHKSIH